MTFTSQDFFQISRPVKSLKIYWWISFSTSLIATHLTSDGCIYTRDKNAHLMSFKPGTSFLTIKVNPANLFSISWRKFQCFSSLLFFGQKTWVTFCGPQRQKMNCKCPKQNCRIVIWAYLYYYNVVNVSMLWIKDSQCAKRMYRCRSTVQNFAVSTFASVEFAPKRIFVVENRSKSLLILEMRIRKAILDPTCTKSNRKNSWSRNIKISCTHAFDAFSEQQWRNSGVGKIEIRFDFFFIPTRRLLILILQTENWLAFFGQIVKLAKKVAS